MTDTVKEQLSAFLDGELPEAETTLLLKRLERDDELKATLSRYSLIGAALRAEGTVPDATHIASRVRAALAVEPVLGAKRLPRWLRPVAGLATAAGVAGAAIALLPLWLGGPGPAATVALAPPAEAPAVTLPAETLPAEAVVVPVVAEVDEPAPAYTIPPLPAEPAVALSSAQLASYLVAHSEYVSPLSRRSVLTPVTVEEPAGGDDRPAGAEDAAR